LIRSSAPAVAAQHVFAKAFVFSIFQPDRHLPLEVLDVPPEIGKRSYALASFGLRVHHRPGLGFNRVFVEASL